MTTPTRLEANCVTTTEKEDGSVTIQRSIGSVHGISRRVIIESPYAGDIEANTAYARACVRDSLARGEAPIASHLLYTQPGILRDDVPDERARGIAAGLAWGMMAHVTVVYTDLGISGGMRQGVEAAERAGRPIEFRSLGAK